jgi:hypothetical protein
MLTDKSHMGGITNTFNSSSAMSTATCALLFVVDVPRICAISQGANASHDRNNENTKCKK